MTDTITMHGVRSLERRVHPVDNVFSSLATATSASEVELMRVTVVINRDEAAISGFDGREKMLDG